MDRDSGIDKNESDYGLACKIGFAIALVKAIIIGISMPSGGRAIWFPISDFAANLQLMGFIDVLNLFIVGLFIALGNRPKTLLFAAATVGLMWLACYSTMGAFVPQAFYGLIFYAAIGAVARGSVEDQRQIRLSSIVFFAIIFIAAGFQKLNPTYFGGSEFYAPNGFFGPIHHFFGRPPDWLAVKVLPPVSIAMEFGIGFGLLWRPRLFAHLAVFFILGLALLHTSVLFVYLAIVPLVVFADPSILRMIKDIRVRALLANPYFWFFTHVIFMGSIGWKGRTFFSYFIRHWVVAILLLGLHAWLFRRSFRDSEFFEVNRWRQWKPLRLKWVSTVLLLVALTPLAAWLGAPAPIGFTMFAGRARQFADHQIKVRSPAACNRLERQFSTLEFADAKFRREGETCIVAGPTKSGAEHVLRRLCEDESLRRSSASIEFKHDATGIWEASSCPQ